MSLNINDPRLNELSETKKNLLVKISNDIENMPSSNSPVYIMAIISKLKNSGITFSDSELELLIECFTENMTINEKNRFDSILKMLKR